MHLFHTQVRRGPVSACAAAGSAAQPERSRAPGPQSERVWKYVNKWSEWMPYEHRRVAAKHAPLFPGAAPVQRRVAARAAVPRRRRAHTAAAPSARRVKGRVDGKIVPIPPSQETVNTLFNANVHSEEEMEVRPAGSAVVTCYTR